VLPDSTAGSTDYDRIWAEVYGDIQDLGPTHRHMARLMRALLRPLDYSSILDVGVGFGHNLPVLTAGREPLAVCGIDISERALAQARQRWDGDFRRLDIARERLPETYDLVCCALVLEHLVNDEAALRNMREMTSRHLLLVTIGGEFERYRPWEEQVGHVRNYQPGELEAKVTAADFEIKRFVRWGFPLYSPISRTLQNRVEATHELSRAARVMARIMYPLFFLNSSRRGDLLLMLASPVGSG
jgi:SAM-dependent methyltransferase